MVDIPISERVSSDAVFEYAKKKGIMFEPVVTSWKQEREGLIELVNSISLKEVVDAFVASLSSRRLDLRSALGSYVIGYSIAKHIDNNTCCTDEFDNCFLFNEAATSNGIDDLNVLNFERFKWGGVRHDTGFLYPRFDLEQFRMTDRIQPINEDYKILRSIIEIASNCDSGATPGKLEKAIDIFPSNKAERTVLIEILGYCGILSDYTHKSYYDKYVHLEERERRMIDERNDWTYPVYWWRGKYGVNREVLRYYFDEI